MPSQKTNPQITAPASEQTASGQAVTLIQSLINGVHTAAMVEVVSVTNNGGVSPVGYVDIQPIVGQLDGSGRVIDHSIIYNARYMRVQGGENAVILDPQKGDVGLAVFCERDSTAAKKTGKKSPPASLRKFSMADAVYCFSLVTKTPSQYVQFSNDGIVVHSPSQVMLQAPKIVLDGAVSSTEGAVFENDVIGAGVSLQNHTHGQVVSGSDTSGKPIAG